MAETIQKEALIKALALIIAHEYRQGEGTIRQLSVAASNELRRAAEEIAHGKDGPRPTAQGGFRLSLPEG